MQSNNQISSELEELRHEVEGVNECLSNIDRDMTEMDGRIRAQSKHCYNEGTHVQEQVNTLRADITAEQERLRDAARRINDALKKTLKLFGSAIDDLRRMERARAADVDASITHLADSVGALQA